MWSLSTEQAGQLAACCWLRETTRHGCRAAGHFELVPRAVLTQAAYVARHALAAYGLQSSKLWNKAKVPSMRLKVGLSSRPLWCAVLVEMRAAA